jgi:hypothetical protein
MASRAPVGLVLDVVGLAGGCLIVVSVALDCLISSQMRIHSGEVLTICLMTIAAAPMIAEDAKSMRETLGRIRGSGKRKREAKAT